MLKSRIMSRLSMSLMQRFTAENAHRAAEKAAKNFGYSSFNELNKSTNERAKRAARAAFDEALSGCQQEA